LRGASASQASGLESIPLPIFQDGPGPASQAAEAIKSKAEAAAAAFEKSDFLKGLREKSDLNKDKNRRALQDKYCYRQAELGIGDCAGLRLIPGATKSGAQKEKTPERKLLEFLTGGGSKTEE